MDHRSDRDLIELLRRRGPMMISEIIKELGVTATAVRNRLDRLRANGLVERREQKGGRGRPRHCYSATQRALESLGQNYDDLAVALWQEIKNLRDQALRLEIVRRVC